MNELLLEPLKYYEEVGESTHRKHATDFFQARLEKSKVNAEENRATVKKYKAETAIVKKLREKLSKKKGLRVLLILTVILGALLCVGSIFLFFEKILYGSIALCVGVALIVASSLLLKCKINPEIKSVNELCAKHEKNAEEYLRQAEIQTAPLKVLFRDDDGERLMEKTLPDFTFDPHYSVENHHLFKTHYDLVEEHGINCSVADTLSGQFSGNPFLYSNAIIHRMGTHTYHGSRTITWTERYRDKDGRMQTRVRSQTLHASVVKPKPFYTHRNALYYGCQASPDLCFTREPKHSEQLSEKEREKKIKRGAKRLEKKSEKALQKGGSFQEMTNSEFDVLFGATDRNHEMQFRLMYTPLGQCNTVDLLTSTTGYGDDFRFEKIKRCNIITSEHAQRRTLRLSRFDYFSFDIDEMKKKFIELNAEYFKAMFFDFAPLFAVPAYMEEPCVALEPLEDYQSYYTAYEHEAMANALGASALAHKLSQTQNIFKTKFLLKENGGDRVEVTAYGYRIEERVDYKQVFGGDGRFHTVAVPWIEYIPVQRVSQISVKKTDENGQNATDEKRVFFHGLTASLLAQV